MPRVSVVLPCYNAAAYLSVSVDSILGQTFRDFEVIAIDDGSRDETRMILTQCASRDSRIRVVTNERNLGLVPTLNRGIELARGEYIARMDADDQALPDRFADQVRYLDQHPAVDVVSSAILLIDEQGRSLGRRDPWTTHPLSCRYMTCFATPVAHTAVLVRRVRLAAFGYSTDPSALHTEDYELWSRLTRAGHQIANLSDALQRYRVSSQGVSLRHEPIQVRHFVSCVGRHLSHVLGPMPVEVVEVVANRIDFTRAEVPLREGLETLSQLTQRALEECGDVDIAKREIRDAAAMHGADILIQCLLKGRRKLRLQAAAEFLARPAHWRRRSRRHLVSKLRATFKRALIRGGL